MKQWSTADVPQRESFAFWNDAVCDAFLRVRTEHEQRTSFQGCIRSSAVGLLNVNRVSAQPHLVRRSQSGLRQDTAEWFFLNVHWSGRSVLAQGGRDHPVTAGGITFHDSTRPFDLRFAEPMALTCFVVPRAALAARTLDAAAAVARPLPNHGPGALFRTFAQTLASDAGALAPHVAADVGLMFIDLLALAIGANAATRDSGRRSTRRACFDQICTMIRTRVGDPSLDLARVAALSRLAPRTLQTLFRDHETSVSRYILEQRLLLAEKHLARSDETIITDVAYAVGFADLSYFSRAFRKRFGLSPSERARCSRAGAAG